MADAMSDNERMMKVLAAGKPGGRHSPLYIWMMENHATLSAEFVTNGPQWATRVPAMGDVGLVDATGQPPSIRTAMQTWYRVCRAMDAPSSKRKVKPPSVPPPSLPPPHAAPQAGPRTVQLRGGDGTPYNPKK
jgi:hypothetical protein